MDKKDIPKPLLSGILYGEFAFWLAIGGSVIAAIGIIIYFLGNQFFDPAKLIAGLLSGKDAAHIWEYAANAHIAHGHWYLQKLGTGDGISMLGIAISCYAGVVGLYASLIGMLKNREKPVIFTVFAVIIIVLVTMSAFGLLPSMH